MQRAEQHDEIARQIAGDRLMDSAMEEYLDHMSQLLLVEQPRGLSQRMMLGTLPFYRTNAQTVTQHRANIQMVARARTVTTLRRLDGDRNALVLQFLRTSQLTRKKDVPIDLSGAILRDADLTGVDLSEADLSGVDLRGAKLMRADLTDSDFSGANLTGANLDGANFTGATITKTQFSQAKSIKATIGPDGTKVML